MPTHEDDAGPTSGTPSAVALSTEGSIRTPAFFRTAARLGLQAAEALEYAHTQGVVHSDVKPANLLVDAAGNVWITDFGLARFQRGANLTVTGDLLGTVRYMSRPWPSASSSTTGRTSTRWAPRSTSC